MLAETRTPIDGKTAGALISELARAGAGLMVDVLAAFAAFPSVSRPEEGVTYAARIGRQEAWIDCAAGAGQAEWRGCPFRALYSY